MEEKKSPRVFISYSHDNLDHKDWVRNFAENLVKNGIDVVLDQWDVGLGDDLPKFMERSLSDVDRVLMICTSTYVIKADGGNGGVGYEAMIVTGELVRDLGTNKFIPVIRQRSGGHELPRSVSTRFYVDLSEDNAGSHKDEVEKLLRELHRVPSNPKPLLGASPFAVTPSGTDLPSAFVQTQSIDATVFAGEPLAIYLEATRIAKAGEMLAWRNLVSKARVAVSADLKVWLEQAQSPGSTDALREQTLRGIGSFAPLFCVALAGVGSGRSNFSNQAGLIDEILNPSSWQRNGFTTVVSLPEAAVFIYQALAGALSIYIGQYKTAIQMLRTTIKLPFERDASPLWRQHSIVGWPEAFARHSDVAWAALVSLREQWPWLKEIFSDTEDFRSSLVAYYLLLNVNDYSYSLAEDIDLSVGSDSGQPAVILDAPLQFMSESDDIKRRAYRLLTQDLVELSQIWHSLGVTDTAFGEAWPLWIRICSRWNAQTRFLGGISSMPHESLGREILTLA